MKYYLLGPTRCVALMAALLAACPAQAGRPLFTEDAEAAEAGSCQLEAWVEKQGRATQSILSPACGIAPGVELGAQFAHARPTSGITLSAEIGVKWAPEAWSLDTPFGALRSGLKLALSGDVESGGRVGNGLAGLTALATLSPSTVMQVHEC
jgi:hypothetical protein